MRGVPKILQPSGACLLLALLVHFGCSAVETSTKRIYQDEQEDSIKQITDHLRPVLLPNDTAIGYIPRLKGYPAIEFYKALRELYLTGGFAVELSFNAAILGSPKIPDLIYQEVIRSLMQTRFEIKRGEGTLRRLQGMIKLNGADSLNKEPWLINLAVMILEKSNNPKNVAYSIRDLATNMSDSGITRTAYNNGTYLREFIANWTLTELTGKTEKSNEFNWTEPLLLLHHTIGPENFNALGDILESMPWLLNGMYVGDEQFLMLYQNRMIEAISDADLAVKIMQSLSDGYRKVFNATTLLYDERAQFNATSSGFDQMAQAELIPRLDSPIFENVTGEAVPVEGGAPHNRFEIEFSKISVAFEKFQFASEVKKHFLVAAKEAIKSPEMGGLEGVRDAIVSGARLVKQLGGAQAAIQKCQELIDMAQVVSMPVNSLNVALDVVKKMNYASTDGKHGYEMMFEMFSKNKNISGKFLFQGSKARKLDEMQKLFKAVNLPEETGFFVAVAFAAKMKYSLKDFKKHLDQVNGAGSEGQFSIYFGILPTRPNANLMKPALKAIFDTSKTDNELILNLRSIRDIQRAQNPSEIFNTLITVSDLSRDRRWTDVWSALEDMYILTQGPSSSFDKRLAPYQGIPNNGSYSEVFLSLISLLEVREALPVKCKFISDFYSTLEYFDYQLGQAGVLPNTIKEWNEKTISNDALIQLLQVSESRDKLGYLLAFHKLITTRADPLDSIALIGDMIAYLEEHPNLIH